MLLLLRDHPGRKEQQVQAFRAFLTEVGDGGLDLRITDAGLEVRGSLVPADAPGVAQLVGQLRGHGVGVLTLPAGLSPAAVLGVLRTLATPVGRFETLEHLLADIDDATRGQVHLGPLGEDDARQETAPADFIDAADYMRTVSLPAPAQAPLRLMQVEALSPAHVAGFVHDLGADPTGPAAAQLLDRVVAGADLAARDGNWSAVLDAAAGVCRAEEQVPEGELKRAYHIAIRRMLPFDAVQYIARATVGPQRTDAIAVLRHIGSEASESLLHLLVEANSMDERRALYGALRQVATVSPLFGRLLGHEEWFVIRNVAELCGDLRAEETVPQLARHTGHPDERVRRAVAGALAKIGTPTTVEPLRHLLKDPSPQVRLQAVQGLDGARSKGLAMTLALALEDEGVPDVQRELMLALGRIGSPDAIQALARIAAPGRRLFNRRPQSQRLAAVEALRLANTPPAATALQALLSDDDPEVRGAAQAALA
ncbi:MAG: HEAT repeat domain-containing protein [Gemmatimonadales bacterium]|nr:HEAT repeat domain-containing protein [Gemmatimonadales bacterium]